MDYKKKYNKYKSKYKTLKFAKLLEPYIKRIIPMYSKKTFQIFPKNIDFHNNLKHLFSSHGEDVIIFSPSWGDNYNKNNKLDINIENNLLNFIMKQLDKSEWVISLLPSNLNFNRIINLYDIKQSFFYKHGSLIISFITSNNSYKNKLPIFQVYNLNEELIINKDYELDEQVLLFKYLDKDDSVLQLGANIGTSCILVDKVLNGNNICVEPNLGVIPFLKKNKEFNKAKFVIIDGIISKKKGMMLVESDDDNKYGSFISKSEGKIVKNYDFNKLNKKYKFNVLFADCEGCLESFFDEYPESIKSFEKIIFEKDREEDCDYNKITRFIEKNNFKYIEGLFHQVFIKMK